MIRWLRDHDCHYPREEQLLNRSNMKALIMRLKALDDPCLGLERIAQHIAYLTDHSELNNGSFQESIRAYLVLSQHQSTLPAGARDTLLSNVSQSQSRPIVNQQLSDEFRWSIEHIRSDRRWREADKSKMITILCINGDKMSSSAKLVY